MNRACGCMRSLMGSVVNLNLSAFRLPLDDKLSVLSCGFPSSFRSLKKLQTREHVVSRDRGQFLVRRCSLVSDNKEHWQFEYYPSNSLLRKHRKHFTLTKRHFRTETLRPLAPFAFCAHVTICCRAEKIPAYTPCTGRSSTGPVKCSSQNETASRSVCRQGWGTCFRKEGQVTFRSIWLSTVFAVGTVGVEVEQICCQVAVWALS